MKETVNTVKTNNIVKEVWQLLKEIGERLKEVCWEEEESEEAKLPEELIQTIDEINKQAATLIETEENPKGNKHKGLKGKVQVVNAPTIQKAEFNYNKEQQKENNTKGIEISD